MSSCGCDLSLELRKGERLYLSDHEGFNATNIGGYWQFMIFKCSGSGYGNGHGAANVAECLAVRPRAGLEFVRAVGLQAAIMESDASNAVDAVNKFSNADVSSAIALIVKDIREYLLASGGALRLLILFCRLTDLAP
ncbi:hypothetical protein L484_008800 [Morus notabilis]|uniref:Uncharacterized protein n=1 Tax=Morus notabilis TaxID=981085 RepID=W9RMW4_9ROSA|nr:hypothetical protein L484_008800 [Morus notabilis]